MEELITYTRCGNVRIVDHCCLIQGHPMEHVEGLEVVIWLRSMSDWSGATACMQCRGPYARISGHGPDTEKPTICHNVMYNIRTFQLLRVVDCTEGNSLRPQPMRTKNEMPKVEPYYGCANKLLNYR